MQKCRINSILYLWQDEVAGTKYTKNLHFERTHGTSRFQRNQKNLTSEYPQTTYDGAAIGMYDDAVIGMYDDAVVAIGATVSYIVGMYEGVVVPTGTVIIGCS